MKTFQETMPKYSNLKIIDVQKGLSDEEQGRNLKTQLRLVVKAPFRVPSLAYWLHQTGTRVTLYLKNVPREVETAARTQFPFTLFGLFQHEHKYSALNFTVQRNTEYAEPVKSKVSDIRSRNKEPVLI